MPKKQSFTFEKHIYVESRSGAFRFKVVVGPLNDSATFSSVEEGAPWARRRRVDLLEERAGAVKAQVSPDPVPLVSNGLTHQFLPKPWLAIKLSDVFDSFEADELPILASRSTETSRLDKLREWFGEFTIAQLDKQFINNWRMDRQSGKLGSGRDPNRAAAMSGENGEPPLTKHQRFARKKAGKHVPEKPVFPVSTQTVRHELNLLRRAVTKYLQQENRWELCGALWQAHYLMQMSLPRAAEPRHRRVSDDELVDIIRGIGNVTLKGAILFAVLTSLRRSEIVSLRWEDVDFQRKVVRLRKPGYLVKTKVHERDVPLLPGAIKVLQDMQPQKRGRIFPVSAADLSHSWRNAADAVDIFDARLHDCRREAISRLVEKCGLSVEAVKLFSGHSDTRTLEKHYLCLNPAVIALRLADLPDAINMAPPL